MSKNNLSFFGGSLLWFGAAISIAEITTGTLLAPLGLRDGLIAVILGHFIGCVLFFFIGYMGAKSKTGAMESASLTFGIFGSRFFAVLNVLQLIGWTAVMIISGANAMGVVFSFFAGPTSSALWCVVIGALIALWVIAGIKSVSKLNLVAVGALFVLSIILGVAVFSGKASPTAQSSMSFALALELSIAMPISWLPILADFTKNTDKPFSFTLTSVICYFVGSTIMYSIGLGATLFAQTNDIVQILLAAQMGVAALLIVILSTVTTTFLDVFSAAESFLHIFKKFNSKIVGLTVCAIGTIIAITVPLEHYEPFLYLIGSVFVPMASIMIADFFINRNTVTEGKINKTNTSLWVVGFFLNRIFLAANLPVGSTIPVVLIIMMLCVITNKLKNKYNNYRRNHV